MFFIFTFLVVLPWMSDSFPMGEKKSPSAKILDSKTSAQTANKLKSTVPEQVQKPIEIVSPSDFKEERKEKVVHNQLQKSKVLQPFLNRFVQTGNL